jgi:RNase P subunit RPR2
MSISEDELQHKTILHLHNASLTILPQSQSLSSHLASTLLDTADEADINLPKSYVDSQLCQRCGTTFVPGITCKIRTSQSRRQKKRAKSLFWVVYHCMACNKEFRTEIEIPKVESRGIPKVENTGIVLGKEEKGVVKGGKRKREKLQGLKNAIEKRNAEKSTTRLDLMDLMKVD